MNGLLGNEKSDKDTVEEKGTKMRYKICGSCVYIGWIQVEKGENLVGITVEVVEC